VVAFSLLGKVEENRRSSGSAKPTHLWDWP
jgi:hypothetical protein